MLKRWIVLTLAILACAYLIPGVRVSSFWGALGAAAVLGILNAVVRPLVVLLTLPITCLTLGLFLLVVNALMLLLAGWIAPGWIAVDGFLPALLSGLVIGFIGALLGGKSEEDH